MYIIEKNELSFDESILLVTHGEFLTKLLYQIFEDDEMIEDIEMVSELFEREMTHKEFLDTFCEGDLSYDDLGEWYYGVSSFDDFVENYGIDLVSLKGFVKTLMRKKRLDDIIPN